MMNDKTHVAVVDIGKLANLGWAIEGPDLSCCGSDIDDCVDALARALDAGPLALGFEAPMYVPYREEKHRLDKARIDEDRAYSASPGACALTKALVMCPYILGGLRSRVPHARATFKWRRPLSKGDVLLFEAFVTHETADNIGCAKIAIEKFKAEAKNGSALGNEPCMSLLAAMLLHTNWTSDIGMLHEQCLVIRHKGNQRPRRRAARAVAVAAARAVDLD
jgi:hypothetical protein